MSMCSRYLAAAAGLALAVTGSLAAPASGDDPPPPVVLGPPPQASDVDLVVWQVGTHKSAGTEASVGGKIDEYLRTSRPVGRNGVLICNIAPNANRVNVQGTASGRKFKVRYRWSGKNVTAAVVAGTFRTRRLLENECVRIRMRVTRLAAAGPGDKRRFTVTGTPRKVVFGPDWVAVVARAAKAP
jgi:hypothetical protein